MSIDPITSPTTSSPPASAPRANSESGFWGEDGFTFGDIVDAVNPLRHIPVVSSVYNEMTGSEDISHGSKIAGGAVFGGAIGLFASVFDSMIKQETGKYTSEHITASVITTQQTTTVTQATTIRSDDVVTPETGYSSQVSGYQAISHQQLISAELHVQAFTADLSIEDQDSESLHKEHMLYLHRLMSETQAQKDEEAIELLRKVTGHDDDDHPPQLFSNDTSEIPSALPEYGTVSLNI